MGFSISDVKKTLDQPRQAAQGYLEGTTDKISDKVNMPGSWNPMTTANEDIQKMLQGQNPFSGGGFNGALNNGGYDVSNAWKVGVVNPVKGFGDRSTDFWKQIESTWNPGGWFGKDNKFGFPELNAPGAIPGVGGGGVSAPGGGPGMPGGFPGGYQSGGAGGYAPGAAPDNAFRQGQIDLMAQLQGQANGTGPSIAANQLAAGQEQNISAMMAAANSGRGGANPALARQAMQQGAEARGAMAGQAATAKLQEQQQAAGLLGTVSNAGRTGDIQMSAQALQAQQQQQQMQTAMAQLQAQYAQMGLDADKANQMAAIEMQKLAQQGQLGWLGIMTGNENAKMGAIMGGIGTGVAAVGAMSDKNVKTDVEDGTPDLHALLDSLTVNKYKYKDEKHGRGEFVSVMAQDLLKTDLGKNWVVPTSEGLSVDYGKGFGAMLAAQADFHSRLKNLEKKGK